MGKPTKPMKGGGWRAGGVPVWAWVLGAVVFLPLIAMKVVFSSYRNASGSMLPTLLMHEDFMVRRSLGGVPQRGQVVAFRFPENREQDFVKRVVALPGEELQALDGRPIINGWMAPRCHVGVFPVGDQSRELYVEYLGDAAYGVLFDHPLDERTCKADADCAPSGVCRAGACGVSAQGPFRVKSGEVWVMGDNRDNSHDSRFWANGLGAGLPLDDIHGAGQVVWLSEVRGRFFSPVQGPPTLPPEAAALKPALDRCLADRPPIAKTTPPAR